MNALYNEIEPFACDWLENLIATGHITSGSVERRSIAELTAADVAGPGQRHFFAGIGGWSYALRLAGVPDDADIWTGSCPCQPFSQAGRRGGTSDPRHLWPAWFALIRECRPAIIFGEQVAGPDGLAWLDGVFADLEGCGYACGAAVVSAAGVGAPHQRHRIYFVAYADEARLGEFRFDRVRQDRDMLADSVRTGRTKRRTSAGGRQTARSGSAVLGPGDGPRVMADTESERRASRWPGESGTGRAAQPSGSRAARIMGNTNGLSSGRNSGAVPRTQVAHSSMRSGADGSGTSSLDMDPWRDCQWIDCADGKRRPVPTQSALFPLAHGVPNRVGLLRGSGNAVVPACAATFIRAALEARQQ